MLRRRFEADIVRRFKRLKREIVKAIVELDGFGLKVHAAPGSQAFNFPRSGDKVSAFMEWLKREQAAGILQVRPGTPVRSAAQNSWMNLYIDSAYQRGIAQAGQEFRGAGAQVSDRWIDAAFNRPVHADRVGLIYTRAYSELEGITAAMDQQISRILGRGIAEGRGPMAIARDINERVDEIGITRARMLARTEVIAAHADASLNAYEEAGVEGVEVEAEFSTAGDDQVCPECEDLEGQVFSLDEARGKIPVHPLCRCAFIPIIADASSIVLQ